MFCAIFNFQTRSNILSINNSIKRRMFIKIISSYFVICQKSGSTIIIKNIFYYNFCSFSLNCIFPHFPILPIMLPCISRMSHNFFYFDLIQFRFCRNGTYYKIIKSFYFHISTYHFLFNSQTKTFSQVTHNLWQLLNSDL